MAEESKTEKISRKPKQAEPQAAPVEKTNFLSWFVRQVDAGRLKAHHMHAVKDYFTAHGLTDNESAEDFEKVLKRYGV